MVVASLNPNHLTQFYHKIDFGQAASIALIGNDAVVRSSGGTAGGYLLGQELTGTKLFEHIRASTNATFEDVAPSGSERRLVTVRKVRDQPLWVAVSIDKNEIFRNSRETLEDAAGAAALSAVTRIARAQAYPTRPVRMIVTVAPGSGPDAIARLIAQKLSENVGNQFYVENVGGAGGNIATARAAQAAPDGYTVLVAAIDYVVNPALFNKVPYDPLRSFEPVVLAGTTNVLLIVNPTLSARSAKELVALIKATPGKYSYASGNGVGSPGHLAGEQFRLSLGLDLVHVPFNGSSLAVGSVVGGHTPIGFTAPAAAVPLIKEGKLRALAGTGSRRLDALPDVPTVAEAGYPDIDVENWYGFLVPARTPKQIVTMLNREVVKIITLPEIKARFSTLGIEPVASTPQEFAERIEIELPKWRKIIREAGIKPE